jgi:hypothetical protein
MDTKMIKSNTKLIKPGFLGKYPPTPAAQGGARRGKKVGCKVCHETLLNSLWRLILLQLQQHNNNNDDNDDYYYINTNTNSSSRPALQRVLRAVLANRLGF